MVHAIERGLRLEDFPARSPFQTQTMLSSLRAHDLNDGALGRGRHLESGKYTLKFRRQRFQNYLFAALSIHGTTRRQKEVRSVGAIKCENLVQDHSARERCRNSEEVFICFENQGLGNG